MEGSVTEKYRKRPKRRRRVRDIQSLGVTIMT